MLIRSQDKRSFINFDNVFSINIYEFDGSSIIDATDNIGTETMATYSTIEKATKALDMIGIHYEEGVIKANKFPELYSTEPIFNMPKDEDVVVTDENGVVIDGN